MSASPDPTAHPSLTERAFLANLRHELRTPINAIIGYSEMLLEDAADAQRADLSADLGKVHTAGNELLARVNEILDPAKIEAQSLGADLETFGANLRHELRTPLNAVVGYTELLSEEAEAHGEEQLLADLRKIRSAADRFLAFINDIISFSAHKPGQADLVAATSESAAMIQDVVKTIRPLDGIEGELPSAERGLLLVVDDNEINRDVLSRRLERQGHSVMTAANGRAALAMVREKKFDLVLLDLMMPELNGYQVLQELKADPVLREIPVIMISALDEVDSVVRCIEMGADDYMPKPFNPVLLRARIGASLEKKRLRDRQRELFGRFATQEVAEELLKYGFSLGGKLVFATAMFSDIRSFTTIAESQSPAMTIDMLNRYFGYMVDAIGGEGGIVNQMVGDGLMAIFGAPLPRTDHRERAVRAAVKMLERLEQFNREQAENHRVQIQIGIGIAAGEVIAGYTGTEMRATYTCVGDTVNLAARLEAHTKVIGHPILIDETTKAALSNLSGIQDRGIIELKGKTHPVHVYSVSRNLGVRTDATARD